MQLRGLAGQVAKFLFSGGVAALVNLGAGIVVRRVYDGPMAMPASVVAGFVLGTLVSFFLNRHITFAATHGRASRQLVRFFLAGLVGAGSAAALATAILALLHSMVGATLPEATAETAAHVGAIGITTVYNFLAMKYYALRVERPDSVRAAKLGEPV
jgi:putative flippase GtrA